MTTKAKAAGVSPAYEVPELGRYLVVEGIAFRGRHYDPGDVVVQVSDGWEPDVEGVAVGDHRLARRFVDHFGNRWELTAFGPFAKAEARLVLAPESLRRHVAEGRVRRIDDEEDS